MGDLSLRDLSADRFDVVICGGGLAGLTLARQLRRSQPDLGLLVVERTSRPLPDSAHKVGESSVELGSQYLERLGLRDYLVENHLIKFGLRFFAGGGTLPIELRPEIGPAQEPIVPSYQLDRGRFENDLRGMIVEDGATLLEGTKVGEVDLATGEAPHSVELIQGGERRRIEARWVIDATGRAGLLRKRMKLTRGTKHPANASWFRVRGKVDITDFVPGEVHGWHDVEWARHRWRSTNHLMGPGYWAWIIPLATGNTSIGLVTHESHVPFDRMHTLEKTLAFLREREPQLARELEAFEILDFRCLKNYSHNAARSWSADRWAVVGEAGAFTDPLYSPGSDFIALANCFTEEMILADLAGEDLVARSRELASLYRSLVAGCVDLYRDSAEVYGHANALMAKIYWDNFAYWSYPCQFFQQNLYKLKGADLAQMTPIGQVFADHTANMQQLFAIWAELAPEEPQAGFRSMPGFPSVLVDAHLALQNRWTPDETFDYMRMRLTEGFEIAGELLLRALDEVGPDKVDELVERTGILDWGLTISDERVAATESIGLARRRALRPLARDVERSLGRPAHKVDEATIRRVLGPIIKKAPVAAAAPTATP